MKIGELTDFLIQHADKDPVSFHMPGHKGAALYKELGYSEFLQKIMDCDVTEIPGADNLFQAEGVLKAVMDRYTGLYGVRRSYVLINGTSCGIIASILAAVPRGGKLIMARNCHKSVFNALSLGAINPVYAYTESIPEHNIAGPVSAGEIERLLDAHPDAAAVILPSPNYYGICSDIGKISEAVHGRGKILIMDQAHGAHLKFFSKFAPDIEIDGHKLPKPAEEQGADIVINSTHKTLGSFTQSAVLNVVTDRIDCELLEDRLQALESSSPSYLLMASMDINADILEKRGKEKIRSWAEELQGFYRRAKDIPGLKMIRPDGAFDFTKIDVDMSVYGLSGAALEELLIEENIFPELHAGKILMLMTGIGNTSKHYARLLDALLSIAEKSRQEAAGPESCPTLSSGTGYAKPETNAELRDAPDTSKPLELCPVPEKSRKVKLEDAAGLVCGSAIIPYPPGIPIVCPGERLTEEMLVYIKKMRMAGEKVIGVNEDGEITAG